MIAKFSTDLQNAQIKLAKAIEEENLNTEALKQKNLEYESLNDAYVTKKTECDAKKIAIVNTLCGIKVVRTEVYVNEGVEDVLLQDCEVGDWVDNDCSVTCGGGEQTVTREVVQEMDGGAECPPVLK